MESLEKTEKTDKKFSFGELLKMKRLELKISARQLSAECNVSQSYISKVEADAIIPTVKTFGRIVDALGLTNLEIRYLLKLVSSVED